MLKQMVCAAAILAAAISNASAQNVDWRGSVLITAATDCAAINLSAGSIMNARYRHPGLGDNGPSARISMIANYFANNLSDPDGDFGSTFQTVKGTVIGGGARAYNASLRMISRTPANITESTPTVVIRGIVRNFSRTPDNPSCRISFQMSVMR